MPDFTPMGILIVFVITMIAGAGWMLGIAIRAALLGLLSRRGA